MIWFASWTPSLKYILRRSKPSNYEYSQKLSSPILLNMQSIYITQMAFNHKWDFGYFFNEPIQKMKSSKRIKKNRKPNSKSSSKLKKNISLVTARSDYNYYFNCIITKWRHLLQKKVNSGLPYIWGGRLHHHDFFINFHFKRDWERDLHHFWVLTPRFFNLYLRSESGNASSGDP